MTQPFELTHDGGAPIDEDNPFDVRDSQLTSRYAQPVLSFAQLLTASTNIIPTPGMRIRVLWVAFVPDPDATTSNLVTISYPDSGVDLYCGFALAHWQQFDDGAVDEVLHIELENTNPVAVTVHYQELP